MANYVKTTTFDTKDALPSGNAAKVIKGAELEVEFDDIATAISSKADTANATHTGTTSFTTVNVSGTMTAGTIDGGTY